MDSQHRCGLQRVLPHLKTRVRQFITDRRGAAAMFLGLGILPAMALGTGAVLVNREFMNLSVMQSAVDTSSIALAKIQSIGADSYLTTAVAQQWVDENSKLFEETLEVKFVLPTFAEKSISVSAQYASKPRLTGAIGSLFSKEKELSVQAIAQFFPSSLEVVFTIDNSADSPAGQQVASGMEKVLNKLFEGKPYDKTIHVSVFAVGTHMNLGTKYADIISMESRALPKPGSKYFGSTETQYKHQKEILEGISPALVNDLLNPGGPGFDAGVALVARPDIAEDGIDGYLARLDYPPESEDEKFRLIVSDNRKLKEGNNDISYLTDYLAGFGRGLGGWWSTSSTVDAKDFFCVPDNWWTMGNHADTRYAGWFSGDPNSWSGWRFSDLGEIGDGVVHFPMMGPLMPLLANSSTVSEITECVKQSIAVNTGSVDEHFTWSYRLLSPNWAKVWSDDGTYPAPYGSGTLKHAWINVGRPTGGGYSSPEDFDYDQPNILPGIFAKFAERKIVLHLILDDPPEGTMKDIEDAMDRYGKTLGWETIDLTDGKGSDLYERIAQNIQRPASMVRLVAKLTDN